MYFALCFITHKILSLSYGCRRFRSAMAIILFTLKLRGALVRGSEMTEKFTRAIYINIASLSAYIN